MIKTIGLLTRKDGWTHEQFMRHWIDIHAPLAHAVPGLRRYVQNHISGERTRADIVAGPDQARLQGPDRDAEPGLIGNRLPRRVELDSDVGR